MVFLCSQAQAEEIFLQGVQAQLLALYLGQIALQLLDLDRAGGRAKFAYSIGSYTRLHWNYELEQYTIEDVDSDASWQIKDIQGENWSSSVQVKAVRNTTDRRFNPTQGTKSTVSVENSGGVLGGDDNFIKTRLEHSYYKTLFWKLVFNWHWDLGYIFENTGDRVPDHERFYLGGIHSVRGYEYQDISSYDQQGREIGGYKSLFFSGEGLVCRFNGQGRVWIQSRKLPAFVSWIRPFRPVQKSNNND